MLRLPHGFGGLPSENIRIIHNKLRSHTKLTDNDYYEFDKQIKSNYEGSEFGKDIYPKVYMLFSFIGAGLIFHPIIVVTHALINDIIPTVVVTVDKPEGERQRILRRNRPVSSVVIPPGYAIGREITVKGQAYPCGMPTECLHPTVGYAPISPDNIAYQLLDGPQGYAYVHPHRVGTVQGNHSGTIGDINIRAMVYIGHFNDTPENRDGWYADRDGHAQWIEALSYIKPDGEMGDFMNGNQYNLATNNCQTYVQASLNYLKGLHEEGIFTGAPWKTLTRPNGTMLDMDLLQSYEKVRSMIDPVLNKSEAVSNSTSSAQQKEE